MTNVYNTITTANPINAAGAEAQMASEAEPSADSLPLPPGPHPLVRSANARMVDTLTFFSRHGQEVSLSNNNSNLEFSLGG